MMVWRHIPQMAAANPRTPSTFLRQSDRSDRPEMAATGPRLCQGGLGEDKQYQQLRAQKRPDRPERPEMWTLHARVYVEGQRGRRKPFHALVGISGRSGRSGRYTPDYPRLSKRLALLGFRQSRAGHFSLGPVGPVPTNYYFNILCPFLNKQRNIENEVSNG